MDDFVAPDFLTEDQDTISKRIQESFPPDIDTSDGSFAGDTIRPIASEESRFKQFTLVQAIKQILPQFSDGEWLDYHAENVGLVRKAAVPAVGSVTVTGAEGTFIPAGTIFSTASANDTQSLDFATTSDATIPEAGTVDIEVTCTSAGANGNVQAGTIILKGSDTASGITAVTNQAACAGGTDEESDDSLRARIAYYNKNQIRSFVGSPSDYKRWALSVAGTGTATIISSQDDSGLVTIILTDSNGAPATTDLCNAVYNYIMQPDNPDLRLAPINAYLVVSPPEMVHITVSAIIKLTDAATIETVSLGFQDSLKNYFTSIRSDDAQETAEVKYTQVSALLSSVAGCDDFRDLKVNGATANISLSKSQFPVLDSVSLTDGEV